MHPSRILRLHGEDEMDFKSRYLMLKNEGKTDVEISKLLFISRTTLTRLKKENQLGGIMRNKQGISENQLKQAESIGLDRHLVLLRVREYGWSIEQAISIPKIPRNKRRRSINGTTQNKPNGD
jgi:hypothetical protein